MNYYQHHIGDFIRDTARLNDAQAMAYLRMIWIYYETEQPLGLDVGALAFKIGANASDVHQILKHFFFEHEGLWHHSRCDKEILAYRSKSEKAKKSAETRWSNAKAMRTHTERNADEGVLDANQEPITNNQEKEEREKPRKRSSTPSIQKPEGVTEQTWVDWLALRKQKKAAVSETVLAGAKREAEKADLTLDEFLGIWCLRGSQGLQADWIKPSERPVRAQVESFRDADERKRRRSWEEMTGQQWPDDSQPGNNIIDITPSQQRIAK